MSGWSRPRPLLLRIWHALDGLVILVGGELTTYTCYGCHEHTPSNIAAEHREEGIRDFADCVECHRSAED